MHRFISRLAAVARTSHLVFAVARVRRSRRLPVCHVDEFHFRRRANHITSLSEPCVHARAHRAFGFGIAAEFAPEKVNIVLYIDRSFIMFSSYFLGQYHTGRIDVLSLATKLRKNGT